MTTYTGPEFLAKFGGKGKGRAYRRRHTPGQMNKTEAAYADTLRLRQHAGEIAAFHFEAVTLKLAADCRLTPDFMVILADGLVQFHEVKGHFEEDAKIKIKVAAQTFPFAFVLVRAKAKRDGGGWEYTDMSEQ